MFSSLAEEKDAKRSFHFLFFIESPLKYRVTESISSARISLFTSEAEAEPTAEQLAEMEAADAAAATETPEADPEEKK